METTLIRKPFQGVYNIIRFNWHFYAIAFAGMIITYLAGYFFPSISLFIFLAVFLIFISTLSSLLVSWIVYDNSTLYSLRWLEGISFDNCSVLVNIHAGFDETSLLLEQRFPDQKLMVYDFYDPLKHTEVSIRRARQAYPVFPGTHPVKTNEIFLTPSSVDGIFLILSAHEIRDKMERKAFFKTLAESLQPSGRIIMVEHLRDLPNFIAYQLGFFHFHSLKTWEECFNSTGLQIRERKKLTPFLNIFILDKNGTAS